MYNLYICIDQLKERTMKSPFQYGTMVDKECFVNRVEERKQLKELLDSGINVMLISPRRWGKSSLVKVAMDELMQENKQVRVCFIDAFSIKTEAEFYRTFAKEIISCTASVSFFAICTFKTDFSGAVLAAVPSSFCIYLMPEGSDQSTKPSEEAVSVLLQPHRPRSKLRVRIQARIVFAFISTPPFFDISVRHQLILLIMLSHFAPLFSFRNSSVSSCAVLNTRVGEVM